MLLNIAIGDAYGAGFEFRPAEFVQLNNTLRSYLPHELGTVAGQYTDDTQMSLALADILIKQEDWSSENIADHFVAFYKRDARVGYSKGLGQLLHSVDSGKEFLARVKNESERNGAAMRSAPIGLISSIDDLLAMSELQASITHNSLAGIRSSQAVALASHYFAFGIGTKQNLESFVSEYTSITWNSSWRGPVACDAIETVNALLSVLREASTLSEVLKASVRFTGDVDTVAALGLGIASLSNEYIDDLPSFLIDDLENGPFGKAYLQQADLELKRLHLTRLL